MTINELELIHQQLFDYWTYLVNYEQSKGLRKAITIIEREIRMKTEDFRLPKVDIMGNVIEPGD